MLQHIQARAAKHVHQMLQNIQTRAAKHVQQMLQNIQTRAAKHVQQMLQDIQTRAAKHVQQMLQDIQTPQSNDAAMNAERPPAKKYQTCTLPTIHVQDTAKHSTLTPPYLGSFAAPWCFAALTSSSLQNQNLAVLT